MIYRMNRRMRIKLVALAIGAASASPLYVAAADVAVALSGAQEVPAVTTAAKGSGTLKVGDDGMVSGNISTTGIAGTAAHIHNGASGKNGPVIMPLANAGDGAWTVPAGSKLTPEQLKAFQDGSLYVNVHTAANPDGEIRGQLK